MNLNRFNIDKELLLTVVIVTKNPGSDIYATLASILPLNDDSVEVLIKDNSDDNILEEINRCFQFKNLRGIHSSDEGIYDAMNQAIELSNGNYLYFLNAGDTYIDCDLLNILKNDQSKSDFFYGNIIKLHPHARQITYSKYINKYSVYLRRVCHQAIVVKKEIFNQIGHFDTNLSVNADYLFILHLFDRFEGTSIQKLISIYQGGGISYGYKMSPGERTYLKSELKKLFNPLELMFLAVGKIIFSWLVALKNIKRPT